MRWRTGRGLWGMALVALALCVAGGAPGCMGDRPAINRVQPDFLDKTQLIPVEYAALASGSAPGSLTEAMVAQEPQWFHQITVVAKPATTGFSGVTSYTSVERVNWEVTENYLIARQSYDQLRGAQGCGAQGCPGQSPQRGEILAVYAIESHFDVRRDYNSTTGEEINVVVENDTDRPWYQRRYMRVDWSANLVSGYTPLTSATWTGRLRAEPVATYFNNPNDPNRPVFDYGDFNGQQNVLRYFDVTNRMVIHPEETNLASAGYPNLPVCALTTHVAESCQPADVLMRVAFRRVDPRRDYQPQAIDGHRMDRFGFFNVARNGFSTRLGAAGQLERRHYAERHNLWMQHHASVPNNGLDHREGDPACQADADCTALSATARCDGASHTCGEVFIRCAPRDRGASAEDRQTQADELCAPVGAGATCDLDVAATREDNLGLCLLPYRARAVRPIAYHLSPNYPERMMPVTNQVVRQWNSVFSHAVTEARYRECLLDPAGGGAAACESWHNPTGANADARFVWVGCHNPVWGTAAGPGQHTQAELDATREAGWDSEACGPQGTVARIGDIRYSMIASVNEYDANGPWGLAGISGDPLTGEVLAGRGAVWQTVTDSQAAFATDMMRILNRDVSPDQFALGQTIIDAYDYIRSLGGREERTGGQLPTQPRPVSREIQSRTELDNLLAATTFDHLRTVDVPPVEQRAPVDINQIHALSREVTTDTEGRSVVHYTERGLMQHLAAETVARLGPPSPASSVRAAQLRGTQLESRLINQERLLAAGADPNAAPSAEVLEAASPARRDNMAFRALQQQFARELQAHECGQDAAAAFSDDVITVMLQRFRRNEVPEDVRFGQTWNFHTDDPAPCPDNVAMGNCGLNYAEIERYLQQYIHYGVLLHELGHSIGERHNFSGSADAMNYRSEYWALRRTAGVADGGAPVPADQIRPRWEHMARGLPFYSPAEERGGVEEYAYSTVMDYKGWNEDAHGLGHYDRAFVLHGYVNMVEAFREVAVPDDALNAFESMTGGYQSAVRLTFTGVGNNLAPNSFHYTDIPRIVGVDAAGNPNIGDGNRYTVFLRETASQAYNAAGWTPDYSNVAYRGPEGEDGTFVLVPYRFGTDDWAGYVWNTILYDAGADMFESMRYLSNHYLDYYFANAFARGRATFNVNAYTARMQSRYLDPMYYAMRNYMYLNRIYQDNYAGNSGYDRFLNSNSVVSGRLGASNIVDTMANAVLMPNASALYSANGTHYLQTRVDGTRVWDRARVANAQSVTLPVGAGREFSTYYDWGGGFYWRENILSAGSYHDKRLGLEYLSETFNWIPGRTVIEWLDPHPLQINVYTMFPAQTLRFFGSLLARDHDDVAPQVRSRGTTAEPQILRTQLALLNLPMGTGANQSGRDPTLSAIDPNLGFTTEMDVMYNLFVNLGGTFDRTASVSGRLWADGDVWALAPAADRTMVTFTDPFTQITYSAVHQGGAPGEVGASVGLSRRDAVRNETGIAARMIGYANILLDAYRAATPTNQAARRRDLQGYVDLLDRMRDFNRLFNTGN